MPSDAISRLNVVADATAELAAEVKLVHERLALMRPRVGRAHSRLKRKCPRIRPRREADANGEMLLDDSSDVGSAGNALPARIECIDFSDPSASKPEGLEYYPEFFTLDEQRALLKVIDGNSWKSIIAKRQQFYGEVYFHTSYKSKDAQPDAERMVGLDLQQLDMLKKKCARFFDPLDWPTQVLVNEYRNNQGIASHFEDFDSFGDIILTISLINPLYMTLKRPVERTNACSQYLDIKKVLLEPGSLLVMKGQARSEYRHGIGSSKWVYWKGQRIKRDQQYRRVSLTVRHLLDTRRVVDSKEDESDTIKAPDKYGTGAM